MFKSWCTNQEKQTGFVHAFKIVNHYWENIFHTTSQKKVYSIKEYLNKSDVLDFNWSITINIFTGSKWRGNGLWWFSNSLTKNSDFTIKLKIHVRWNNESIANNQNPRLPPNYSNKITWLFPDPYRFSLTKTNTYSSL